MSPSGFFSSSESSSFSSTFVENIVVRDTAKILKSLSPALKIDLFIFSEFPYFIWEPL